MERLKSRPLLCFSPYPNSYDPNPNLSGPQINWMKHIDWIRASGRTEYESNGFTPKSGDIVHFFQKETWIPPEGPEGRYQPVLKGELIHSGVVFYVSKVTGLISMFEKKGTGLKNPARIIPFNERGDYRDWYSFFR